MRFNIKECEIYGMKRPYLFFSGWVESKAKQLVIKINNTICYEMEFSNTKSKIHSFSIRTELQTKGWSSEYEVYVYDKKNNAYLISKFISTPYERFAQKIKKSKIDYSKDFIKPYRKLYDMTYDLKDKDAYNKWIKEYETFNEIKEYDYNPLISIIIPVYNVNRKYLSKCLDSILNQTYQNFEICLADDCSPSKETIETLKEYAEKDKRIRVLFREKNGHISEASNSALSLATGEFVAMMDNDDELMPQALNEIIRVLNDNRNLDFIYTDEDKIDLEGKRSDPQFKPDLAIDKLYGGNYICHFNVIRKTIMDEVEGFRKGYEGAQDFDLFIRILEITDKFYHIPKVLYHWRMIPGSTALDAGSKNYAGEAGKKALEDLFLKKNKDVQVDIVVSTHYSVEYFLDTTPLIEIIMYVDTLEDSLKNRLMEMKRNLSYDNLIFTFLCKDIIRSSTFFNNLELEYQCIQADENYAITANQIVKNSSSEHFIFLDQFATIDSFDSIELMSGYCAQNEIGIVGGKVLNTKKVVIDSGFFLVNKKLLPVHYATYFKDYGHYGNLLVANNYRIVEDSCVMISKEKFIKCNGLDEKLHKSMIIYDLALRLSEKGYRNVILPRVEVILDNKKPSINQSLIPIEKWEQLGIDTTCDKFYNINLSDKVGFRLDK